MAKVTWFSIVFHQCHISGGIFSGCLYSEALAVPLVDDPLSAHPRRVALVDCCPALAPDVQTILAETVLAVHLRLVSELEKLPLRLKLCCTIWCLPSWHAYGKESMTCIHTAIQSRLLLCILRTSSPVSSPFHSILACGVYHRKHLPWQCG